jgi:outer membrane protein TolC
LAALSAAAGRASDADRDSAQLLLLAKKRYDGGEIAFIDVLDAEQRALNSERQQIQIRSQQASLSIFLAKALGGGWQE